MGLFDPSSWSLDPREWGDSDYKVYDPRTWSLNPASDIAGLSKEIKGGVQDAYNSGKDFLTNKAGNDAAQNAMAQARTGLQELQQRQRAQRAADLQRALGYFGPVGDLMKKFYGPGSAAPSPAPVPTVMPGNHFGTAGPSPVGTMSPPLAGPVNAGPNIQPQMDRALKGFFR